MGDENIIYIDGEYYKKSEAKISVFDHGLLYGDGIFEGIRAYNGRVLKLEEHIERLYHSAKTIMLEIPESPEKMQKIVIDTCKKNNIHDGYIRLVVTRGMGDLGIDPRKCPVPTVICIAANIVLYPEEMYTNGLPIITATQRRNKATILDPQVKSLNYLNNILAKTEATRAGVHEALMLTHDGLVAECTGDNVFIIKNNIIYTPPIHLGILNGITRQIAMELAEKEGIQVKEQEFTLFNVYNADECFLTGTAAEVIAVINVDGRVINDGKPGRITKTLLSQFRDYVSNQGAEIK